MTNPSQSTLIIGVTGLPASGKNEFAAIAKRHGFVHVIMGDVIRGECIRRGLEPTRENCNHIMIELRKEEGEYVVAKRTLVGIEKHVESGKTCILVDGLRSMKEVELFREKFPEFIVVAIHASPRVRKQRVKLRQRNDDASSTSQFNQRDARELEVGIGKVIALADYLLSPPDNLQVARKQFEELVEHLIETNRGELGCT